jgi:hypothetical protein
MSQEVPSGLVIPEGFDLHLILRTTVRGDLFAVGLVQPVALQTLVRFIAKFRDSSIQDASRLMLVPFRHSQCTLIGGAHDGDPGREGRRSSGGAEPFQLALEGLPDENPGMPRMIACKDHGCGLGEAELKVDSRWSRRKCGA